MTDTDNPAEIAYHLGQQYAGGRDYPHDATVFAGWYSYKVADLDEWPEPADLYDEFLASHAAYRAGNVRGFLSAAQAALRDGKTVAAANAQRAARDEWINGAVVVGPDAMEEQLPFPSKDPAA